MRLGCRAREEATNQQADINRRRNSVKNHAGQTHGTGNGDREIPKGKCTHGKAEKRARGGV